MGDAVGRLGWDERVSGTASAPLHVTELTLLFGEHTCQEQSCAAPSLPQLAALKSMNFPGVECSSHLWGKDRADVPS